MKTGGVIVVGELSVTYLNGTDFKSISTATPHTIFRAYEPIDDVRYLLSDSNGGLHVLVLDAPDRGPVRGLMLERMGTTSQASTISYLSDGITFIGSSSGDSQLVQLSTEPDEESDYVREIERWTNIGPVRSHPPHTPVYAPPRLGGSRSSPLALAQIVDFVVVDLERHGQGSLVTCSGAGKDGSLRIVRNGIGINEQARIDLPGIKGLWSAQTASAAYLVLSFISETRVMAKDGEGDLGEVEIEGFEAEAATVNCAATPSGHVIQVTSRSVRLVDGASMQLAAEWSPPSGGAISMAAIDKSLVLLATAGTQLHLLDCSTQTWVELSSVTMEHEVACLAICSSHAPTGASDAAMQTDDEVVPAASLAPAVPPLAACGLWTDLSIRMLTLPTLAQVHHEQLGGAVIPRSLAFAPFGERIFLLCALGDGQMMTYTLADGGALASGGGEGEGEGGEMTDAPAGSRALSERKVVTIGTKPISLTPFYSHGALHVFAASDRPTVLHANSSGKLLYSNVNLKAATHMTPFPCDADAPDTLAIASEDALVLGTVDEVRKLHIRSVYLNEQPRRISHLEHVHCFAVLTMAIEAAGADGEERERNFVKLFDETTFELCATFELTPYEAACSTLTLRVPPEQQSASTAGTPTLLVVGTAFARDDEPEPTAGRLLVFDVSDRTLELVCEHRVKGAAYSLAAIGSNGLLAGVNNKLQLHEWQPSAAGSTPSLKLRDERSGHILVLYIAVRGEFVLVGDLMKSLSLYQCNPTAGKITELARDYSSHWMTSVAFLDDDTYLGAESHYNLFVARKQSEAATDDDRGRLEIVGEFHLGEFVNCFRRGSLAMQVAEVGTAPLPTLLYGSVNGVLGLIASLPQEDFEMLSKVQTQLSKVIKGVGGFSHSKWRAFSNDRKTVDATHVLDGDLIESYLALGPAEMAQVVEGLPGTTVEELTKRIEELARLH